MKDPKAIRKAIMTAKSIAAMVDPHFARVPLPEFGTPAPDMAMPDPQQFASGGDVGGHVVNNPMSVFPKPQRMWDGDMPGGAYLSMPDKSDVTGHKAAQASIGIGEGGKPYFHASRDEVDETGTPGKGSALVKTNLFKQKAGWRWLQAPEGHEGTGTIVSVEHRGNHHYVLDAHFPNGVELSRYPDAPSEPRLRPTTRGSVELGPQVGSILVRGREHPVHSHAIVREYGGRVGYADGGMPDDDGTPDYAAPDNLGLYSHAAATAASFPQAKASPAEFRGMLANKGVKPSEFEESGYDQAFANQPQVTREQVAAHFHENRTPIVEKSFRSKIPESEMAAFREKHDNPLNEASKRLIAAHTEAQNNGVNLRDNPTEEYQRLSDEYRRIREGYDKAIQGLQSGKPHHEEWTLPGGENYREVLLKHGGNDTLFEGNYGHFKGEPNILTHLLMSDRTDEEGKRVLHLDELQSDWAQKGRKIGFDHGISAAPYVTNTNDWVDLGLKRALREAAKNGHDKLVWTPGQTVADRYDLSKRVTAIHHEKNEDGTYNLLALDRNGSKVYGDRGVPEGKLEETFGKEIAGKIASGEGVSREEAQANCGIENFINY